VIDAGYEPHMFFPAVPSRFAATVLREVPWTADKVKETVGGAVGAFMIGYPRWKYGDDAHASEFTHYEAGAAHTTADVDGARTGDSMARRLRPEFSSDLRSADRRR
jgi:hypothetical protein